MPGIRVVSIVMVVAVTDISKDSSCHKVIDEVGEQKIRKRRAREMGNDSQVCVTGRRKMPLSGPMKEDQILWGKVLGVTC